MVGLRFIELQSRPMEFLDFTSVTLDEFQQLVSPFEAAFHARMAAWRMDGKPRTARRFTVYKNCPLPTPEDRLFFVLTYLKTYTLQVVQGRLFGMVQGKANQWIHVLLPALLAALRALGDAPSRSLTDLAQRLGVSKADAAAVAVPHEEEPTPATVAAATCVVPAAPLLPMTARNGGSSAPKTLSEQKDVLQREEKGPHREKCPVGQCPLTILFLSDTYGGRTPRQAHRRGDAVSLARRESGCLQDLGFLAFTLPQVEILMPTKKSRGQELTEEQQQSNQALHLADYGSSTLTAVSSAVAS